MLSRPFHEPINVTLGLLVQKESLWVDSDGDGYPDQLRISLCVAPNLDYGIIWAALCNLAMRLNMQVTCLPSHLVSLSRQCGPRSLLVERPNRKVHHAALLETCESNGWRLRGHSPGALARILNSLAVAEIRPYTDWGTRIVLDQETDAACHVMGTEAGHKGTAKLCVTPAPPQYQTSDEVPRDILHFREALFTAPPAQPRASRLLLGLQIPARLPAKLGAALVKLAARASAEATELTLPLAWVRHRPHQGPILKVELDPGANVAELEVISNQHLSAKGSGIALARLLEETGRLWFDSQGPGSKNLVSWLERLDAAARLAAGEGFHGQWAHSLAKQQQKPLPVASAAKWAQLAKACRALGMEPPATTASPDPISRRMTWAEESDRLLALADRIPSASGAVECRAFLSKPSNERKALAQSLREILTGKGYGPTSSITVLNAYKPGVDWLLGEIEPKLPEETCRVRLSFRPFEARKPGQLEMPSRWIQEIYPAPDLLALKKGWPPERVKLCMDPDQKEAYRLTALDEKGHTLFDHGFTPPTSCFSYLPCLPEEHSVNPTCIGLTLRQDGRTIWAHALPSDREVFWRRFQDRWLPEIKKLMIRSLPKMQAGREIAFWEEVRLEVAIRESDERLGLDEERIAPMEALHEDIYFAMLEFMQGFCREYSPEMTLQLGRIVPVMRSCSKGKPRARLRLKPPQRGISYPSKRPTIIGLSWSGGKLGARLDTAALELAPKECIRLCRVAQALGLGLEPLHGGGLCYKARPARPTRPALPAQPSEPPPQEEILGAHAIGRWTKALDGFDSLHVWQAGTTWQGRPILAVEANTPGAVSVGKARYLKPTLLVNARHHANEVSGSNAALSLAWKLAVTPEGHEMLGRVNLVIVPLENADGVATLEELLPGAPGYKLHAARYNALGAEWYSHYYDDHTPFPEARVKTLLFRRWLPEYMLDLHGVPSHEWEQPFAGYLNHRFREYWIPRSFVYAILPFFKAEDHPGAREAETLVEDLSAAMGTQEDIGELNRRIHDRYQRYAAAFEPELFNAGMCGTLVVVPTSERIGKTNFGKRYWPLVKSEVITEVLDEVATGPWLERCGRAHQVVAWAMLKRMARAEPAGLMRRETETGVSFAWIRQEQ
jgi:Zinc carboxypeptidase